ncbi:PaaX family transcriptional regulator C-terminal domain-containing protein [Nocardia sp. KC 131]|uniref:PaaX family transcriptional regulator n=1 Tax=Nocardia arseniciresistens TaxID=3392119 RepID=UPI00398F4BBB
MSTSSVLVVNDQTDVRLPNDGPPSRRLIVTLFGLYARPQDNWLSISTIVKLMGNLGTDEPAVRSSVSRLKRRGILESQKRSGVTGYALSTSGLDVVAEGDHRIFDRRRATVDDEWVMVVFSVPESERERRHELRATLTRAGFGTVGPGVWIAPGHMCDEVRPRLARLGLDTYVEIFEVRHVCFTPIEVAIQRWWDFDQLAALYSSFIDRYTPIADWSVGRRIEPSRAFAAYVPMLTEWRRLPYMDPGLPIALLPSDWPGIEAEALFDRLHKRLRGPAQQHADVVLDSCRTNA